MTFRRLSLEKMRRAPGDSRHYRLPKNSLVDEQKLMNLKHAGERFMDAFAKRRASSPTDE